MINFLSVYDNRLDVRLKEIISSQKIEKKKPCIPRVAAAVQTGVIYLAAYDNTEI